MTHFPVTGLRSVDLETPDIARSEHFYTSVWGLDLVTRHERITYLRASGTDHHVVALRQSDRPALKAITFRLHSDREFESIATAFTAARSDCSPVLSKIRNPMAGRS